MRTVTGMLDIGSLDKAASDVPRELRGTEIVTPLLAYG